jgi:hypothetical protein
MNIKVLGLAATALLLLVLIAQTNEQPDESPQLLPGLKSALGDIERLSVKAPNAASDSLTLSLKDDKWVVAERSNYPIDFAGFVTFLDKLSKARLIEQKTAKQAFHAKLGVADAADDEEAVGRLLRIEAGEQRFEVIVGNPSRSQEGTFVRYPGEDQVWLASETLEVSSDPIDWIDPVAINISSGSIQRIEMHGNAAEPLIAIRDATTSELIVSGVPAGAELKYPGIVDSLTRTLTNLRVTDVKPYSAADDAADWQDAGLAVYELDSEVIIQARTLTTQAGDKWLQLQASGEPSAYSDLGRWQFKISDYVYNELNKTLADLLREPDPEVTQ